ncbi:Calnexin-like [Melia azedarach]|uniref:Calnexin-like n=1 Tax=Melia azedarach TaxID=155640 RepID=A0ACC1YAA5_MELAZ|nr:Calnexin-like [Melia azedarach]
MLILKMQITETEMIRVNLIAVLVFVVCWCCFVSRIQAADDALFYEAFDDPFYGRWVVSEKDDYKGMWKHAKSQGHDDYGLLVSQKARKYAIVKELSEKLNIKAEKTVLQYEVRLQNELECGGAYLKFLRPQSPEWKPLDFDNDSRYSIMFGPDKCGPTNKVHFIFNHKNPKTGEYVEHHLQDPPSVPMDDLTHVYTAILQPDNKLRILIDGKEEKKASFLSDKDFEPPLIPAKSIPDPNDKKPEDWDEQQKIPDPDAVKPDDWDEDAPPEIEDFHAKKPEGWLDDEPEEIDDPEASKPEDWHDEEDGEWEPPTVVNPKCATAPGCGKWKRPMSRNLDYKGKWQPPLIENPNYKGAWKPKHIPNPHYFEVHEPDFEPIAAIGIEIWTMQDGILFDNILIATDEKVADLYRETTWKPKFDLEKAKLKAEKAVAASSDLLPRLRKAVFDLLYKIADIPFLDPYKSKIIEFIEMGEEQPNIAFGILISVVVVVFTMLVTTLFCSKKSSPTVAEGNTGKAAAESSNNQGGAKEKEDETENVPAAAPAHRKPARKDA